MTSVAIGDRVRVSAFHHSLYALRGTVTCAYPVTVKFDVYPSPVAISADNLTVEKAAE